MIENTTLKWYLTSGVTETIGEMPINRMNASAEKILLKSPIADPLQPKAPELPDNLLQDATRKAKVARTLMELKEALQSFTGCSLKNTAKNTVFGEGVPSPDIMLIGEAPGADEDRLGRPFVGLSGQLLDKMLNAAGFSREKNAYISNILPWRPPGNRSPSLTEITLCLPFIQKHIELVSPKVLVLVGGISMSALLNRQAPISQVRGVWQTYLTTNGKTIPALPVFHPAFLLRTPAQKKAAWHDMLLLKEKLKTI